jgi:hypothetical protein
MKAGDKIRVQKYICGIASHQDDYTVEEFRHCLGIFLSEDDRTAQEFTPLCELYEPAPDAERGYISNYGVYYTKHIQSWMDLPEETK